MEKLVSHKLEIDLAFQEIFLLALENLKLQTISLESIIELESKGLICQAYDSLLRYGESRFACLSKTIRVDPETLRIPSDKSDSLIALENEVHSLFVTCARIEAHILKRKSVHLGLILEIATTCSVRKAYSCLMNFCKTKQYE